MTLVTSEAVASVEPKVQYLEGYNVTEDQVYEFNKAFGHPHPDHPFIPSKDEIALRIKLIQEELKEVEEALHSGDLADSLKELSDLQYVVDGLFVVTGLANLKEAAFMLVHQSNMSKLGEDGKPIYREDGKVLKGPNYKPVDKKLLQDLIDFEMSVFSED